MKRFALGIVVAFPTALALQLWPNHAEACGGTFCDSGPNSMPVDQTGENVLFHIGDNYVDAHIQIQYDPNTDAAKFAWVIPVPKRLFSNRFFSNKYFGYARDYPQTTRL